MTGGRVEGEAARAGRMGCLGTSSSHHAVYNPCRFCVKDNQPRLHAVLTAYLWWVASMARLATATAPPARVAVGSGRAQHRDKGTPCGDEWTYHHWNPFASKRCQEKPPAPV